MGFRSFQLRMIEAMLSALTKWRDQVKKASSEAEKKAKEAEKTKRAAAKKAKKVKKTQKKQSKKSVLKKKISKKSVPKKVVTKKAALKTKKVVRKPVPKKAPKKNVTEKVGKSTDNKEEKIGVITHYFSKVGAGVIEISAKELCVGDTIIIKGPTTELKQKIKSLQINRIPVDSARKGEEVGIEVKKRVRPGDEVFRQGAR